MTTYSTFLRSCTDWKSFARARKMWQSKGLSYEQALAQCERYNNARNARQIRRGTKMEFTAD